MYFPTTKRSQQSTQPLLYAWASHAGKLTCNALFIAIFLSLHTFGATAEQPTSERFPMQVQRIASEHGLSQNTVLAALQDSQGFVWLATENGLNRYDGYNVTSYYRGTGSGLPDDFVYSIAEDSNGDIWVGTARGGLARWIRRFDRFETVDINVGSRSLQRVKKLLVTDDNRLWVGTRDSGLTVISLATGKQQHFEHQPDNADTLPSNRINALFQDRGGLVWIGTDNGLARFDETTQKFIHIGSNGGRRGVSDRDIRAIFEDHQGVLWIGTESAGLDAYHRGDGQFIHYPADASANGGFCGGAVRAIVEDSADRLWSATDQGLCVFDPAVDAFVSYGKSKDLTGLQDNDLLSLMIDRSGQLWIGTRSDGVSRWNPQSWQLGHTYASLPMGSISSFATDPNGFWVGSTTNGLLRVNNKEKTRRFLNEANGLTDKRVMSMASAADGGLWVGTMKGGLLKLTSEGQVVDTWKGDSTGKNIGLPSDGVMSLLEDSQGRLWIGLFGGGVARLDPNSSAITPLQATTQSPTGLLGKQGLALAEDLAGTIWVGTELGLNRYDKTTGTFESFAHNSADPKSLSAESVYALHVDASGTLWAGTAGGGLNKVVVRSGEIRFDRQQELLDLGMNLIYGIHSDLAGNLWLSGNRGLVRYTPSTRQGKRFRQTHGLQGDEFNFGAHHAGIDGHLYFGGPAGFNRFDPMDLDTPTQPPKVVLTRIQLSDKDLPGQFSAMVKDLIVGYEDYVVAFEFAAMDYADAGSNRFEYRLLGHDDRWIGAGSGRRVSYSNMAPGSYTFQVRGANSAGLWSAQPAAVKVTFEAPPWRSRAAYGIYAIALLALILFGYRTLLRRHAREVAHREELHRLAYYDALTTLPNRHQLLETGDGLLAQEPDEKSAVLHVNLDHFKRLNDSLGHAAADRLLVAFAERLALRAAELCDSGSAPFVARIGGDEFALIVPEVGSQTAAQAYAVRLQSALSEPLRIDLAETLITVSVGMALYPTDGATTVELLKCADIAMRGAKQTGRNTFRGFEAAMVDSTETDLQMEAELHAATESEGLELYYQPKVNAKDLQVCGAEALIRWNHPERGLVSPGLFIPMAERTGLIAHVDRWVMRHAFEQQEVWQRSNFPKCVTSLNVSAGQFSRPEFLAYLRKLNARHSIEPDTLEIEITEGVLMLDAKAAQNTLNQIKDLGFRVAIDDFGTGYSSLSYLKNFPVDVLKIDRSFVMDLETDNSNRSICRAILGLARSLGLEVVAEGVETEAQYQFLRDEGCDQIQGYWVARPEPVATFEAMVRERRRQEFDGYVVDSTVQSIGTRSD